MDGNGLPLAVAADDGKFDVTGAPAARIQCYEAG